MRLIERYAKAATILKMQTESEQIHRVIIDVDVQIAKTEVYLRESIRFNDEIGNRIPAVTMAATALVDEIVDHHSCWAYSNGIS